MPLVVVEKAERIFWSGIGIGFIAGLAVGVCGWLGVLLFRQRHQLAAKGGAAPVCGLAQQSLKRGVRMLRWFRVPMPLGPYNPGWALLREKDGADRLYFVVETKGSLFGDDPRDTAKSNEARSNFKALAHGENPARLVTARNLDHLLLQVQASFMLARGWSER